MSRMIPAKIRSLGIDFYKKGLIFNPQVKDYKLTADIGDEQVVYDLDGAQDTCTCTVYQKNGRYCPHIAAIEEYLKNQTSPENEPEKTEALALTYSENITFLDQINGKENQFSSDTDSFSLGAHVHESHDLFELYSDQDTFLFLDLRLYSDKLKKSYVIKDIPALLHSLSHETQYLFGASHTFDLSYEKFDENSQQLLDFLVGLNTENKKDLSQQLFIKSGRYLKLSLLFLEEMMDLIAQLPEFSLNIGNKESHYFSFIPLDNQSEILNFIVESQKDYIELSIKVENFHLFYDGNIVYYDQVFYKLNPLQTKLFTLVNKQFLDENTLRFDYSQKDKLAQALQQFALIGHIQAPDVFLIKDFQPLFSFGYVANKQLKLTLQFDYQDFIIDNFHDLETLDFSRNLRLETKLFSLMKKFGFARAFKSHILYSDRQIESFFVELLPAFQNLGQVSLSSSLTDKQISELPQINIDQNQGLLDISFDLPDIENSELSNLITQLENNASHYMTQSGKYYLFDEKFENLRIALKSLNDDYIIRDNHLEIKNSRSFQISKIFENMTFVSFSDAFQQLYQDLIHPESFAYDRPKQLTAQLRPYQETGVRWMNMLTHYGLSGILADDMGLGKTLQAITYLLSCMKKNHTALITAPASLIYNWASEFNQFSDNIDFIVVDGNKKERSALISDKHQIYITSYGSFLKDFDDYQEKKLDYLLMDEAQVIKNYSSKTNKALSQLHTKQAFALSGTPLENKVEELWAIFQVLMPDFLPSREKFNKMKVADISKLIQPFVLRRTKEKVLKELPDKMEFTQYNHLDDEQKKIYLAQLELMQNQVRTMDKNTLKRSRIEILSGITRLRQICNTPALFMPDYKGESGKLNQLFELLEQIKSAGHRPLVFSQFTSTFPHIEKGLEDMGMTAYKLTGSTPAKERLSMVQAFNSGSRDAFLISLKAGGVGLNLTSADVVILVDLWWNPAVEEQAVARAHRMGQKNTVEVIRLISKGTIEEKIMAIQERKKDMISNVLEGNHLDKNLTEDEIKEILGL
ncbi:MAG: DEAD/DEAH box helicase [Streptococcaceae bacterium]|nr:DEAD/DEAH box helicase [Streptococcaceae bacterium]